jgi:hypothetical protein
MQYNLFLVISGCSMANAITFLELVPESEGPAGIDKRLTAPLILQLKV